MLINRQCSYFSAGTFANTLFQEARAHAIDDAGSVQGSDAGTELSSVVSYSPNIDTDLSRMDGLMDTWLTDLKRNVLVSRFLNIYSIQADFSLLVISSS